MLNGGGGGETANEMKRRQTAAAIWRQTACNANAGDGSGGGGGPEPMKGGRLAWAGRAWRSGLMGDG